MQKLNEKHLFIEESDIPLEGNLGLLAYGDIAFTAWRKKKQQAKKLDDDAIQ